MTYRTEYKAGDRVRVLRVPANEYLSPRGKFDLVIGDELEIGDLVYYDLRDGRKNLAFKVGSDEFGHIPSDCVELI